MSINIKDYILPNEDCDVMKNDFYRKMLKKGKIKGLKRKYFYKHTFFYNNIPKIPLDIIL